LHEAFAVALASTIVIVTVWMIMSTFTSGAATWDEKQAALHKEAYERQKDLLLYGLSLLGTVTGYYFGRVPAERRADSAQQSADKAQRDAKGAQLAAAGASAKGAKAVEEKEAAWAAGREIVREAKRLVEGVIPSGAAKAIGGAAPGVPDVASVQAATRRMEELLNSME
jgi:hypothetical protein